MDERGRATHALHHRPLPRYRERVGPLLARPSDIVVHQIAATVRALDPNPPDPGMLGCWDEAAVTASQAPTIRRLIPGSAPALVASVSLMQWSKAEPILRTTYAVMDSNGLASGGGVCNALGIAEDDAGAAFRALEEAGYIRRAVRG